jgi:hypothetical protein
MNAPSRHIPEMNRGEVKLGNAVLMSDLSRTNPTSESLVKF